MCEYMCPGRPKDSIESLGARVAGSHYQLLGVGAGNRT